MTTKEATLAAIEIPAHLPAIEQYEILLAAIEESGHTLESIHTADPLAPYHEQIISGLASFTDLPFLVQVERRGEHFAMYRAANPLHLKDVLMLAGWSAGAFVPDRYGGERFKEHKTNRAGAGLECGRLKDTIGSVISISEQGGVVALGTRAMAVLDQIVARQEVG